MSEWTTEPKESGAYWMQLQGASPDICWIHNMRVWFVPPFQNDNHLVAYYTEHGAKFWGPIQKPPTLPATHPKEDKNEDADHA